MVSPKYYDWPKVARSVGPILFSLLLQARLCPSGSEGVITLTAKSSHSKQKEGLTALPTTGR